MNSKCAFTQVLLIPVTAKKKSAILVIHNYYHITPFLSLIILTDERKITVQLRHLVYANRLFNIQENFSLRGEVLLFILHELG